jgi:hypothetical protein
MPKFLIPPMVRVALIDIDAEHIRTFRAIFGCQPIDVWRLFFACGTLGRRKKR